MENPIEELEHVVRSLLEVEHTSEVFANIDKYFTEDAQILYFNLSQIYTRNGRENLKAAYQVSRALGFGIKITMHAVMVNKEQTQATLDLTQSVRVRLMPIDSVNVVCNFIVRLGLRKSAQDNKYRIYLQDDNFPTDLTQSGLPLPRFILVTSDLIKAFIWLFVVAWGRFFMLLGIF
ncbi:hypothetical protein PCANC_04293 [Puccinia coronata f. sp. avenae]|uniref:SigF-like NTF2-like domain-containing protein n=1 Tax=Puccinia coronata f. sp. avenae TaxID=200324 RepID=A0A2N5VMW8_9BASI|nr:hypothetical protein PCANC_23547 [Puccinia coronata f. sp. avenae]PLW26353.1 hypothetical protein PCASD_20710 [Puccinia coronata f. sp. avenae]PLW51328.1 hypothetical protein PCASD_01028 [Puccinia coronata f. sp. avenae]PLW53658.1 hypothetical protein PCANC_04293 [Puccinia coronata f. sp. avenae]